MTMTMAVLVMMSSGCWIGTNPLARTEPPEFGISVSRAVEVEIRENIRVSVEDYVLHLAPLLHLDQLFLLLFFAFFGIPR